MKWAKSTRFGLYAALEMARAGDQPITANAVAERYAISPNHLAKVLSSLARAGLVRGSRGVGGGYRLARSAEEITMLDVVEAIEGKPKPGCPLIEAEIDCAPSEHCGLDPLFSLIADYARNLLQSCTLADAVDRKGLVKQLSRLSGRRKLPSAL